MKIRVLGGGWYGCHIALALLGEGHDVELHEVADTLFAGASGGNPARLHLGFHYPRSQMTRALCQASHAEFLERYGQLTRGVPINLYAVADGESLVDFGTYCQVLRGEVDFVVVDRPDEFGLQRVEGAMLTGERHILVDRAREHFIAALGDRIHYGAPPLAMIEDGDFDWTIDCTFCALDAERVDRYEPCVTGLLEGPADRAVTIMDGPFPSVYPWDPERRLSSLTSARWTPFSRCKTYDEARELLAGLSRTAVRSRCDSMLQQMALYWPEVRDRYKLVDYKLTIRAQPLSGADSRFVDVVRIGQKMLRVRAGKIDAVVYADKLVRELMAAAD